MTHPHRPQTSKFHAIKDSRLYQVRERDWIEFRSDPAGRRHLNQSDGPPPHPYKPSNWRERLRLLCRGRVRICNSLDTIDNS